MNKQQEFLLIVQTAILIAAAHSDRKNAWGIKELAFTFGDAVDASRRIPDDKDSSEAADDFLNFMLYPKLSGETADRNDIPHWFSNPA